MDFIQEHAAIIVWSFLLIFAIIAEVSTAALVSVWFALGAGLALVLAAFSAPVWLQISTAIIVSGLTFGLFRYYMATAGSKGDKTEAVHKHAIVGKSALVTETISNTLMRGQISIDGEYWSAKSASEEVIEEGSIVLILDVSSAVCVVEPDPMHYGKA